MPPKPKLHKKSGKSLKNVSKVVTNLVSNNVEEPSTSSSSPVVNEQQFEAELCWCIQQLHKLNNTQGRDYAKSLNVLMSNSTSLIQKRQVMRLTFGDYRAKMQDEEKKAAKKISMKVTPAKPSQKSMFLKKAFSSTSTNDFKFNFSTPQTESNSLSENMDLLNIENDTNQTKQPQVILVKNAAYKPSDNSFRFNFSNSE